MATITTFSCNKCGKKFNLSLGLLSTELAAATGWNDKKAGIAKLPPKEEFMRIAEKQTTENAFAFSNSLAAHREQCGGEVSYQGSVFAH